MAVRWMVALALVVLFALPRPASAATIMVGNGTAASCTEVQLRFALVVAKTRGGGTIRFQCGPAPATIEVTAPLIVPSNTTITGDGLITLSHASNAVGEILGVDSQATVTVDGITFSPAFRNGGTGISNAGTLTVRDSVLADFFPAIFNSGALTIRRVSFLFNAQALANAGTAMVRDSTFQSNGGANEGAGIHSVGTLDVEGTTFNSNHAFVGAAILAEGTVSLRNCLFSGNLAELGAGIFGDGGLTVVNSMFADNTATSGGGIDWIGTLSVSQSMFYDNTAGGIRCCGAAIVYGGEAGVIRDSVFDGNEAHNSIDARGGAIFNFGTLTVANSTITRNTAHGGGSGFGGGIYNVGSLTLRDSTVANNVAISDFGPFDGGGIYTCCGGSLTLRDTVVTENTPNDIAP